MTTIFGKLGGERPAASREDIMNCLFTRAIVAAVMTTSLAVSANAQQFEATFSGFLEVGGVGAGQTGAIFSAGQGTLTLRLNRQQQSLAYTLNYSNTGTTVTQAHIHFGKIHVGGGIIVFLCSNLGNGPPGTPLCPTSGTVTGTLTPASVVGPAGQGIAIGNFDGLAAALVSNTAYGNIHTTQFPAGEIRGEIRRRDNQGQNQQ
jgi:CHRD domain